MGMWLVLDIRNYHHLIIAEKTKTIQVIFLLSSLEKNLCFIVSELLKGTNK
jgi:hypothetical protein